MGKEKELHPLLWFWTLVYLRPKQIFYWALRRFQFKFLYPLACPIFRRFKKTWPLKKRLPSIGLNPQTVKIFRQVFTQNFHHRNQPLDQDRLKELVNYHFTFLNHAENVQRTVSPLSGVGGHSIESQGTPTKSSSGLTVRRTLNARRTVSPPSGIGRRTIDWNGRYVNRLWNFHLHYFDYIVPAARAFVNRNQVPMRRCQNLVDWWIEQTDVGRGDGWHPYPTSLRIVNWIYAYALIAEEYDDQAFLARWRNSIYQQLDYLSRHLEYDVLANHLLKNVKALVIGSLFFGQNERLPKWEKLFWEEFGEQVLEDGGHYERSPMYHAQALADFLECYALHQAFNLSPPSEGVKRGLGLMAYFLEAMCFSDQSFALFNDSAATEETKPSYILSSAQSICEYTPASSPGERMGDFPQTGYYVWVSSDRNEKIIIDAGPPSVEYNTGHAHCDMLSYELSLFGQMFIVDSGVCGYGGDLFREYCRSTRAHNTVMVDGIEQSRPWSTFRMAQRAKLIGSWSGSEVSPETYRFEGAYRRYNRGVFGQFDRSVIHQRSITRTVSPDTLRSEWVIGDIITRGTVKKAASSFIHLHPSWKIRKQESIAFNKKRIQCECGDRLVSIEGFVEEVVSDKDIEGDISLTILHGEKDPVQSWYFPDFGDALPNYTIRFDYRVKAGDKFGYRIKVIS